MTSGTYETIRACLMRACSGPHFAKLKSLIEQKRNSQFGGGGGTVQKFMELFGLQDSCSCWAVL